MYQAFFLSRFQILPRSHRYIHNTDPISSVILLKPPDPIQDLLHTSLALRVKDLNDHKPHLGSDPLESPPRHPPVSRNDAAHMSSMSAVIIHALTVVDTILKHDNLTPQIRMHCNSCVQNSHSHALAPDLSLYSILAPVMNLLFYFIHDKKPFLPRYSGNAGFVSLTLVHSDDPAGEPKPFLMVHCHFLKCCHPGKNSAFPLFKEILHRLSGILIGTNDLKPLCKLPDPGLTGKMLCHRRI